MDKTQQRVRALQELKFIHWRITQVLTSMDLGSFFNDDRKEIFTRLEKAEADRNEAMNSLHSANSHRDAMAEFLRFVERRSRNKKGKCRFCGHGPRSERNKMTHHRETCPMVDTRLIVIQEGD